jgi:hypothetical protein
VNRRNLTARTPPGIDLRHHLEEVRITLQRTSRVEVKGSKSLRGSNLPTVCYKTMKGRLISCDSQLLQLGDQEDLGSSSIPKLYSKNLDSSHRKVFCAVGVAASLRKRENE